ncbi:hypothetical protein ACFZB4_07570 [Streptomyces pseudovenezuelae]|uniref:hypothetical protein n=1 Tax=Streptomyces pseudovenezuelae TaxID=67350 RepID=UPI0036EB2A8C
MPATNVTAMVVSSTATVTPAIRTRLQPDRSKNVAVSRSGAVAKSRAGGAA